MIAPATRVQAYCSNEAPLARVEAVDRLDEGDEPVRDEVVELAVGGSSRTFREARYLTIGEYARTRRSRADLSLR